MASLIYTVAENEVESLGDTKNELNAKELDFKIANRKAEVKVDKPGDARQRRK